MDRFKQTELWVRLVDMKSPLASVVLVGLIPSCGGAAATASGHHHPAHEHSPHPHAHPHHPDHHRHDFSNVEEYARRFDDKARAAWQKPEEVVRFLDVPPGAVVADVGAGTGYFLPFLNKAVGEKGRVLGLDVEPAMVEHMTHRIAEQNLTQAEARLVAATDPQLPPASVDRILIVNTWHHIGDRVHYTEKLASALRPNGVLVIVDFTRDAPEGPPPEFRLQPEQVAAELTANGLFRVTTVDEDLPHQYVIRAEVVGR